ncbi:hypothetical protein DES53_107281 [Roseimicrobium gellanilyticum]|uniref:Uncharacterized protein n=2 Tax=Roseimicrobium gellanilyticum TaxID=748857 RepID=A0A366HIM3_9BACT|nr:hypothetical protein DES53_107281 [Roseimicrobium gellanilyticum]
MLFDQTLRQNSSPKLSGESEFVFLNRSSRQEFDTVRCMLEQLASAYPQDALPELRSRVRCGDDTLFHSAVFELLVYSILKKLGYDLQPHPELANGSTARPDFLVTGQDGFQFYLEAVLASEEGGTLSGKSRMIETTLDAIREARHDNFWVDIQHSGLPQTQPSKRKLISAVLKWLDTLDPDKVPRHPDEFATNNFFWEHEDWKLRLRPRPISQRNRGKSKSLIGITQRPLSFVTHSDPIREAIVSKGHRYGQLDKPLLIAVNFSTPFLDRLDEVQALFGTETFRIDIANESEPVTTERLPNGAWLGRGGPQYTRVSGA